MSKVNQQIIDPASFLGEEKSNHVVIRAVHFGKADDAFVQNVNAWLEKLGAHTLNQKKRVVIGILEQLANEKAVIAKR
jgi:flagellar motor switch protein FliG